MKHIFFASFLALVGVGTAQGHDFWISRGGYKSPTDGVHCCGQNDCSQVPAEQMSATPSGWRIDATGEVIPYRETHSSEDGLFWRCQRHDGARRCFFAPMPST